MKRAIWAAVLFSAMASGQTGPSSSTAPAGADQADLLAAESLRNSATSLLVAPAVTPGRAGRLVATVRFAQRLAPQDPEICRLLANIHEGQGKNAAAADSLEVCLQSRRDDYALSVRWLTLKLNSFDSADQRTGFLKSVIGRESLPAAVRAEAAVQAAAIFGRQGDRQAQLGAINQAIQLDVDNPAAIEGLLAMQTTPAEQQVAESLLGQLRGNPLAAGAAWELAALLDSLGLADVSVEMFGHAWSILASASAEQRASGLLAAQYFSAMLDAGLAEKALTMFLPMLANYSDSLDLRSLAVEAYRALGQQEKADQMAQSIEAAYKAEQAQARASPLLAAEMAWFYLVTKPQADLALNYARQVGWASDSPVIQRIVCAAELTAGDKPRAEVGLRDLIKQDAYAAAFLAEHYFGRGDRKAGQEAIAVGAGVTRGGPAFRRLLAVARKHAVEVPPSDLAEPVRKTVDAFDRRYLEMGQHPERFLEVTIRPAAPTAGPGEPIIVQIDLANRGPITVPVGDWGLVGPSVSLEVQVAGPDAQRFADLPLAAWPAPRRLAPGQTVTCTARLDAGGLAEFLAARSLDDIQLTVSALLNPVQRGKELRSGLPSVKPATAQIVRMGLLGEFDRSQVGNWTVSYQSALGRIVRDLKHGQLAARIAAAGNIASLLNLAKRLEAGQATVPEPLAAAIEKTVLLSMLQAALSDDCPTVRAEVLAALKCVSLDESILRLLGGVIDDSSPLVRLRVAELFGASNSPGSQTILEYLTGDADELVRLMAGAFLPARKQVPTSGRSDLPTTP